MKPFYVIFLLLVYGCQYTGKNNGTQKTNNSVLINKDLAITANDSLLLDITRHKYRFPLFADSSTSFCKISGDTLKLYLSTGYFEGCYALHIHLINDTLSTSFDLFDNYSQYKYKSSSAHITLNKNEFLVDDYITCQVRYHAIGEPQRPHLTGGDTVRFSGKIRLKIRNAAFSFEDFSIENNRNNFYAKLKQQPNTITELSLYGCQFTELPEELLSFTNLETLDLTGNNMSASNFELLKKMKTIKSLNLTGCNLATFPLPVTELPQLEALDLWNNNIKSIPDELYNVISLKELTIGNNNLHYLSPKIAQLINLQSFESSATNIRVYPDEMTRLKKLTEIYPSDTMQYIPQTLVKYAWGYDTILSQ